MKYTNTSTNKQADGFTLTEMIVAMLIVGLTTAWVMPQSNHQEINNQEM